MLAVDCGHSREALGSFEALGSSTLITALAPLNCDLLSSPWSFLLESKLSGEASMSDSGPSTMPECEVIDKPLLMRCRD